MNDLILQEERVRLERTLVFLKDAIHRAMNEKHAAVTDMNEQGRFIWEDVEAYYAEGEREFDRLGEMLMSLEELNRRDERLQDVTKMLRRFRRMLDSPYFARVDFRESPDSPTYVDDAVEEIYIGRASLMDERTLDALVYDWRSPIASLFYRGTAGEKCSFEAPAGTIRGMMPLKRQYQIKNGKLNLYIDSNLRVADEMLADALSRGSTGKMHAVAETIQSQQDEVIRDSDSEILLVQGAAGSGKTAVALHRVAYLLYEGHQSKMKASEVLLLSPSSLFAGYIADVLPELGEENLRTLLYEEMLAKFLPESLRFDSRLDLCEALSARGDRGEGFLGSDAMVEILNRAVREYVRHGFAFRDFWYAGECMMTAQMQKSYLLSNPVGTPPGERLQRLIGQLTDRVTERRDERIKKIGEMLAVDPSRAEPMRTAKALYAIELPRVMQRLRAQLAMDPMGLYRRLLTDDAFFARVTRGMALPENMADIREAGARQMRTGRLDFAHACCMMYLQISLFGARDTRGKEAFARLRQLVVDEAQDLSFLQYAVLRMLAPHARLTAVGDLGQCLSGDAGGLYERLAALFAPRRVGVLTLDRSYRSTRQITDFANRLTDTPAESFAREGAEPTVRIFPTREAQLAALAADADARLAAGAHAAAILCKTASEARAMRRALGRGTLIDRDLREDEQARLSGLIILPVSLAKGLEFDAVLIPDADGRYKSSHDRRILYVACTRALDWLGIYAVGEKSPLLG